MMSNTEKIDTKNKIFLAAAELFSRDGFYKVSVREICEVANITKPVLYYYFKDKENLLLELVKETHKVSDKLKAEFIKPENDFTTNLKGVARIYCQFVKDYSHFIKLSAFVQFMHVPPSIKEYKIQQAKKGFGELNGMLIKAQRDGVIDRKYDPEILMQMLIGPIIILLTMYVVQEGNFNEFSLRTERHVDFWIDQFVIKND